MGQVPGWFWRALILPLIIGCELLVHYALGRESGDTLRAVLLWLPALALAVWVASRRGDKRTSLLVLLSVCAVTYLLGEADDRIGLAAAYGVPHAAIYLFLLWLFGRTLLRGREPLITGLARRHHGQLPRHMEVYTRRFTYAWCLFFIAQLLTSAGLFMFASLDAWSLFVNLLNLPLLVLMFTGEYAWRMIRHADFPHASIATVIRTFTSEVPLAGARQARMDSGSRRDG